MERFNPFFHISRDLNASKRRGVLFADGIAPGNGTSASESDTEDNNISKPKKLSARAKNQKTQKNSLTEPAIPGEPTPSFLEKEIILEAKVRLFFTQHPIL